MSYSVYAYLTDAKKVKSVYNSKDESLLNRLYDSLKEKLDDLNKSFPEELDDKKNSELILKDIIEGKVRFPKFAFLYAYVYELICEFYGELIYNSENIWQLDKQSVFIPIPLSENFPYIISIESIYLHKKKKQYLALSEGEGIGDYDYEEERNDLEFIMDEAIEQKKDLVICVY